jgi:ribosome maturation factor RimP
MDQHSLQPKIRALAEATVARLGFDLVAVEWVGGRRGPILRLSIDAPGGVNAEDCARVSDAVSPLLDAADPIEVPYHLEVSSPGIERPVQRRSDFERFRGYRVKIQLREGPGRRRYLGVVGPLDGEELLVHVDGQEHRISLDLVDRAHLVLDLDEYQKLAEGSR